MATDILNIPEHYLIAHIKILSYLYAYQMLPTI